MNLRDKTALITGASKGLGRALAGALADKGSKVVLVARGAGQLEAAVEAIRGRGGRAFGVVADVGDKEAIYRVVGQAAALAGPIDLLINNASTLGPTPLRLLADTECEDLERVLAVNVLGPFRLTKAVLGSMLLRDGGTIVNVSSDASVEAYPAWGSYGVSKAALDHLTRIWSQELGRGGVRMLSVDPGEMDTTMHAEAMPDADRSSLARAEHVAARIVEMLEESERATHGSRLTASTWSAAS